MRKILVSLSIIGVVAAIAIGGTIAYFSDVETSTGNTITAGTIDLAVNSQNPFDSAVVAIYDVKPSEEITDVEVRLRNVGTNDGIADLHILLGESSENIDSEPECEAEGKTWNPIKERCEGDETLNENICEVMIYDYCYDENNNQVCDEGDPQGIIEPSEDVDLGLLPVDMLRRLWLSFHLDKEADNEYQGDTCTFDIEFTLHQIMPEMPGMPI